MAITARAGLIALAGVLLVFGWPAGGATIALVEGLLLVGVIVDVVLAGSVRGLHVTRAGGTSTRLGEPVTVTLTVHNGGQRRVRGLLRDAWPPSAGATPRAHRVDVPPGERRFLAAVLVPTRRGDRRAERVTVRSVGPLGLAARQSWHRVPGSVRVLPPFTSRKFLPERLARLRQLDGLVTATVRGQGTEFDSLREYVEGDDVRSVDWRATARRGDVVVRTWRPERDRRVILVLDTSRTSAGRVGDAPRLDASMDAALLLAALAVRAGDRVELLAFDRSVRARVDRVAAGETLAAMVQAMAPLEPALVETDARALVAELLRRARQRALVVLFTGLDPAVLEEGLLPVLPSLTSRHAVVLAAVADPRVAELAAGRGDLDAVYCAAAAESAQGGRRRMRELLRRQGVEVVDGPPESFPAQVADAYLSLKAAGRL